MNDLIISILYNFDSDDVKMSNTIEWEKNVSQSRNRLFFQIFATLTGVRD